MSLPRCIITFACVTQTLSSRNRVNNATAANFQSPSLSAGILPQSNRRQDGSTITDKSAPTWGWMEARQLARQPWNKRHEYGNKEAENDNKKMSGTKQRRISVWQIWLWTSGLWSRARYNHVSLLPDMYTHTSFLPCTTCSAAAAYWT